MNPQALKTLQKQVATLTLSQAMQEYRTVARQIDDLESHKDLLRGQVIQHLNKKHLTEFETGGLRALHGVRLHRIYQVTPESAAILAKAKVVAYITSGPVDQAVKAGLLHPRTMTPFVKTDEIPYLEVREVKP